jgi:hypothetical protein
VNDNDNACCLVLSILLSFGRNKRITMVRLRYRHSEQWRSCDLLTVLPGALENAVLAFESVFLTHLSSFYSSCYSAFHLRGKTCNCSHLKSLSEPSAHWPRSNVKTDRCHNGSVCERTIPSNGTPSVVTGAEPSWVFKHWIIESLFS